MIQLLAVSTV